jgi:hypothetical protein
VEPPVVILVIWAVPGIAPTASKTAMKPASTVAGLLAVPVPMDAASTVITGPALAIQVTSMLVTAVIWAVKSMIPTATIPAVPAFLIVPALPVTLIGIATNGTIAPILPVNVQASNTATNNLLFPQIFQVRLIIN